MGRLREGESSSAAAAEATAILGQPVHFESGAVGYSSLRRRLATPLFLVQAITALVLLVACVNLASLALAGSASRQRELALRQAIGASRRRVVRQLFTEALVLSTAGGGLALLAAYWINGALLAFLPRQDAPALPNLHFQLNPAVLGFAFGLVLLATFLTGLLPALRVTRTTDSVLKAAYGATQARGIWLSRALLSLQVAVCVVLLLVGGVFLQTVRNLRGQEAGYREEGLLLAQVSPPMELPAHGRDELIEVLRARAASLPQVEAAGFSHIAQLSGGAIAYRVGFPGQVLSDSEAPAVFEQRISPGFLSAMGTPLIGGRDFTHADHASSQPVALVNQAFVRRFLPDGDPLGQRFYAHGRAPSGEPMEIVGLVTDSKWLNLREDPPPMYYRPYAQRGGTPVVRLSIRTSGNLDTLAKALVQTAQSIHPEMVLDDVVPFREIVNRTLVIERLIAQVSGALAAVAVLIVCLGVFGVLAFSVAGRTREIGVRIALGATRGRVQWLVLRESLLMLAAGVPAGLFAASFATRVAGPMLYGLAPTDARITAAVVAVLVLVSLSAAYVPARRAGRVDAIIALRAE